MFKKSYTYDVLIVYIISLTSFFYPYRMELREFTIMEHLIKHTWPCQSEILETSNSKSPGEQCRQCCLREMWLWHLFITHSRYLTGQDQVHWISYTTHPFEIYIISGDLTTMLVWKEAGHPRLAIRTEPSPTTSFHPVELPEFLAFAPDHPQLSKWRLRPPQLSLPIVPRLLWCQATAAQNATQKTSANREKGPGSLCGWKHKTRRAPTTNKSLTLFSIHNSDTKVRNMYRTKIHANHSSTNNCASVYTARSSKTCDLPERAFLLHMSPTED